MKYEQQYIHLRRKASKNHWSRLNLVLLYLFSALVKTKQSYQNKPKHLEMVFPKTVMKKICFLSIWQVAFVVIAS